MGLARVAVEKVVRVIAVLQSMQSPDKITSDLRTLAGRTDCIGNKLGASRHIRTHHSTEIQSVTYRYLCTQCIQRAMHLYVAKRECPMTYRSRVRPSDGLIKYEESSRARTMYFHAAGRPHHGVHPCGPTCCIDHYVKTQGAPEGALVAARENIQNLAQLGNFGRRDFSEHGKYDVKRHSSTTPSNINPQIFMKRSVPEVSPGVTSI